MRRTWPILVIGLALVASLAWGFTQSRARAQLALRTENQYHQSLYRLHGSVVDLEESLGTLLATREPALALRELQELRVFANMAIESLAGLPLLTVSLERTQNFLNSVRNVAEEYAYQLYHGQGISDKQRGQLRELHDQALYLKAELGNLTQTFASQGIRWSETENVTRMAADGNGTTPIVQGFGRLEDKFQAPPGEEGATVPGVGPLRRPKGDLGAPISQDQAVAAVTKFLDLPPAAPPQAGGKMEGHMPVYLVSATKTNGVAITAGVSELGGHVVWLLDGRPVPTAALGRDALIAQARAWMAKNGMGEFEPYLYEEGDENDNVAVLTMVPVRSGVWYFSERAKLRLAQDNGELLGYDALDYYANRHVRDLASAKLSPEEAAARVSPGIEVTQRPRLGVIDVFRGQEALVYEVQARLKDQPYQIYVDAVTGEEVRVLRHANAL